jgi:hypothetical protein
MISDTVLNVENRIRTVTDIPLSYPTLASISPQHNPDSQLRGLFLPVAWCDLTSIMRKPWRWQVTCLMPLSKVVKMPLRFRHPTTTLGSSHASLLKDSASLRPKLPKGWVYAMEEVHTKVKTEVVNPGQYLILDALLTCNKCKRLDDPLKDPYHRHHWALNITEALPISPSISKKTAVKYWLVTSVPILTPNPFVEGQLSLGGPTYHSEIHAAAISNLDIPVPLISADDLRLLDTDYMGHERVDKAIGELGDHSLQAEVNCYH